MTNIPSLKKCKTCKITKLLDCFEKANDLYYPNCLECNIKKLRQCKKCGEFKDDIIDFNDTPSGVRKEYCNPCYANIQFRAIRKKCACCKEYVLKTLFSVLDNNSRNRRCNPCRDKLKKSNAKTCKICKIQQKKEKFEILYDNVYNDNCMKCVKEINMHIAIKMDKSKKNNIDL